MLQSPGESGRVGGFAAQAVGLPRGGQQSLAMRGLELQREPLLRFGLLARAEKLVLLGLDCFLQPSGLGDLFGQALIELLEPLGRLALKIGEALIRRRRAAFGSRKLRARGTSLGAGVRGCLAQPLELPLELLSALGLALDSLGQLDPGLLEVDDSLGLHRETQFEGGYLRLRAKYLVRWLILRHLSHCVGTSPCRPRRRPA